MRPALVPTLLSCALLLAASLVSSPARSAAQNGSFSPAPRIFRARDGSPAPLQGHERIRDFLRGAEIVEVEQLETGSTRPIRLTLERDGLQLRAIFRAVAMEREATRIRDGRSYAKFYDRAIHEAAAYELARMLEIDMIPPTVVRSLAGQEGTVQLWIEDAMTESDRIREGLRPPRIHRWRRQHQIMRVFDALVYNSDRNTGNRLIDSDWTLWMIDHTRAFQRPRGDHDFSRVEQLPEFLWIALRELDHDQVRQRLGDYLEPLQFMSLENRHEALLEYIEELIEDRGRSAVLVN